MKLLPGEQGGAQWLQNRVGRITASRVVDVMNFRKDGKPGADRKRYFEEILCERLTGMGTDHFVSGAMENGTLQEPFARAAYEVHTGDDVELVGLVVHPAMDYFAASADGLVGADGMVEFKAPTPITHIGWLDAKIVPSEHEAQMFSGMVCCEREWCDFLSFCPQMPLPLQRFMKRLEYDEARVAEIEQAVRLFHEEVEQTIDRLRKEYGEFPLPAQIAAKINVDADDFGVTDAEIQAVDPSYKP